MLLLSLREDIAKVSGLSWVGRLEQSGTRKIKKARVAFQDPPHPLSRGCSSPGAAQHQPALPPGSSSTWTPALCLDTKVLLTHLESWQEMKAQRMSAD